jgi:hypothetical protein
MTGAGGRETLAALEHVDHDWTQRAGVQLRFTITGFDLADLRREGVAVAVAKPMIASRLLQPSGRPAATAAGSST